MIEGISHVTFVVSDLEKTSKIFEKLLDAKRVYSSGDQTYSLYREQFYTIAGQWIALMETTDILNRTYHHLAFKIKEEDFDCYLRKVQKLGLEIRSPRNRVEGEGRSIYFYDYDNNLFELHTGTLTDRLAVYNIQENQE